MKAISPSILLSAIFLILSSCIKEPTPGINAYFNDVYFTDFLDKDGDGYTNFEEYEAGTAANDANDIPRKSSVILKLLPLILN